MTDEPKLDEAPLASAPTMMLYARWQKDQPRIVNRFEVTGAEVLCSGCGNPIQRGQELVLFALGPDGPEEAKRHDAGEWYSAVAGGYHGACLGLPVE